MKLIRKPLEQNTSFSLGNYIFKLAPYWPLFLGLVAGSVFCAWLYLSFTTLQYQTNAQILFREDKTTNDDNKDIQSLDLISPKKTVENEIDVIHSNNLIAAVVNDLGLYAPVYEKGLFKDELAYNSSLITVSTNDIQSLRTSKTIPFTCKNSAVIIDNVTYPLNKLVRTPYGNLTFNKNPHLTDPDDGGDFYISLPPLKKVIAAVSESLTVSLADKQTTVINLQLFDPNADRGEDILNSLIKEYNLSIDREKNVLAANTEKFIDERLGIVEKDLLDMESKQQKYKANTGAVDVDTQGKLFLQNVSTNDQKVSDINIQLSVLDRIENYVRSKSLSNGIVPSTVGVDDAGLTEMVKNIYDLQLEVEGLKKTTGENNPLVTADQDKINKIRPQILENLDNQRQSLKASRANLSSTNNSYSSALQAMPQTQKTLVDINRELTIKSDIYTFLLQKKEETALSFITKGNESKIINKAESSELPVKPKPKIIYLASFLFFIIIGFVFVSIRESLQSSIMFQADIENLTELPVISEIMTNETNDAIVIGHNHRTLIAEQFRRLRTTLHYLGMGNDKKRILITSAISGEGKSFIALNLAMSLAMAGKKVILLDFDLNNPSLHTKLNIKKGLGITEFLEGSLPVEKIIQNTAIQNNLHFISAGKFTDNPSELILNGKPEILFEQLGALYDYIVVDVAPVGPISDAYILSPLCDATLYVVRHAYTPKTFVERIDKHNKINNLKNAAIVFNAVSSRSFSSYGYGYGYGYVYGNKNDSKRIDIS